MRGRHARMRSGNGGNPAPTGCQLWILGVLTLVVIAFAVYTLVVAPLLEGR